MKQNALRFWLPLCLALTFTYFLQINLFLHPDNMYLLHAASILLTGGTYVNDIFETNPPLIMYLYTPVVLIAKCSSLNILYVFRLYLLTLCALSFIGSHYLLAKVIENTTLRYSFIYLLMFCLLFLPIHEFGQREHLLLIFSLPYVWLVALRLENKPISWKLALWVGAFASFGIALKPFFLTLPLFIEGYYCWQRRTLLAVFRLETLVIACMLIAYVSWVALAFPQYFHVILPIVSRLYFIGTKSSWGDFFSDLLVQVATLAIIGFSVIALCKPAQRSHFCLLLFCTLLAFFTSVAIPRSPFFYHVLPAFCLSYLLIGYVLIAHLQSAMALLNQHFNFKTLSYTLGFFLFSLIIFFLPTRSIIYTLSKVYHSEKDPYAQRLIAFFDKQPLSSYDYFSATNDAMLFNFYASGKYVGRFPFFWWEKGLERHYNKEDEAYLVKLIAEDLRVAKPHFVLIDTTVPISRLPKKIAYLTQFNQYKSFKVAWLPYRYYTTIGRFEIYEHSS